MASGVTLPTITISPKGEDRVRSGHPWVYRSDVVGAEAGPGDVVQVNNRRKMRLGYALYSDRSEISLRFLARGGEAPTLDTWRARLAAAVDFRESLKIDATAYRVVHGEADRLPGLVVDRYGSCLVVQALVQGVDRLLPELTQMLVGSPAAGWNPGAERSARSAPRRPRSVGHGSVRNGARND